MWDDAVWPAAGVGSYEVENIMSSGQGKLPFDVVTDNNLLRQRYENNELGGLTPLMVTTTSAQGIGNGSYVELVGGMAVGLYDNRSSLLIVGDSTQRYGYQPWYAPAYYVSDPFTMHADWLGFDIGVTGTTAGVFEYRAVDKYCRWTANGDTAGLWQPITIGNNYVPSGTVNRGFYWICRSIFGLPATDLTANLTSSGTLYALQQYNSAIAHALSLLRYGFSRIAYCGAGGATCDEGTEMLPWWLSQSPGAGFCVWRLGANSLKAGHTAAFMIGHAQTQLDALITTGKQIAVVGTHPRWGDTAGTAMPEGWRAAAIAYNNFLRSYCLSHATSTRYVDPYQIGADPAFADWRPASGMLIDTVHDAKAGLAPLLGKAIATALQSLGAVPGSYEQADGANLIQDGYMIGTGGTFGAGSSGALPTGWSSMRLSGADLTCVHSIESRLDKAGQWAVSAISATAASQRLRVYTGDKTLASLGKAVDDTIEVSADVLISALAGTFSEDVEIFVGFTGGGTIRTEAKIPAVVGQVFNVRLPKIKIPAGSTALAVYVYVWPGSNTTATIKFGDVIVK